MPLYRGSGQIPSGEVIATQGDIAEAVTTVNQYANSAANNAQDAEDAFNNAEQVLDNFKTRYLGTSTVDLTQDLEGNALIDGALYFNTTDNIMRVYDANAGNWRLVVLTATQQAAVNTVAAIDSDVITVSGISTDVSTVAAVDTNVTNVSSISTDVTTVSGISGDVTTVAGSDTSVNTVATNITDVNTAATNITDINTAATNITAIQNAPAEAQSAANSASAALTSENNAASSESSAATSASNAATSETNAANSASAAQTAETNTQGIYENFNNRYQGDSFTEPTQRPDSTALQDGDLFFDTSDNNLKVRNGSVWEITTKDNTDIRSLFSASGDISYNPSTGTFSYTERTNSQIRGLFTASGDASYNASTGTFSVTTYKSSDFDTDFSNKSTTNLVEGTNLYYTDTRARNALSVSGDLSYNSSTGDISFTETPNYTSSDFDTDFGNKTTDNLTEGSTNKYFTTAKVDAHLFGGTGVGYGNGQIFIGQEIGTGASPTFNSINANFIDCGTL